MKIYTKTGDEGKTSLFGGERVWKDNLRINCYGTVDELNSIIGLALSFIDDKTLTEELTILQNKLFDLGADLATPLENGKAKIKRIDKADIKEIENKIDIYQDRLPELRNFILPGGYSGASFLHFARTVCRRAERELVNLTREENTGDYVLIYLNRLSDYLFVLARLANVISDTPEVEWKP